MSCMVFNYSTYFIFFFIDSFRFYVETENLSVIKELTLNLKKRVKKKEETDQQSENLKLFLKTGNGTINEETGPKKRGNQSTN